MSILCSEDLMKARSNLNLARSSNEVRQVCGAGFCDICREDL
jgi:hypothetical protein